MELQMNIIEMLQKLNLPETNYTFNDLDISKGLILRNVLKEIDETKDDNYKNELANKLLSINSNSEELFKDINALFRTNYSEINLANICTEGLWRHLSNAFNDVDTLCALIKVYLDEVDNYYIMASFMNINLSYEEETGKYVATAQCDEPLGLIMSTVNGNEKNCDRSIRMISDWCDKLQNILNKLNN